MATHQMGDDFDFAAAKQDMPESSHAPDGQYTLEVRKCEFKYSKGDPTKGKPSRPMFAMTCSIVNGPYAGLPVWHNLVYTEENQNAKRMFYGQLELLGVKNPGKASDTAAALVGRVFTAQIGHREWNGSISNQIDRILTLQSTGAVGVPSAGVVPPAPSVQAPQPMAPAVTVTPAVDVPQAAPVAPAPAPADPNKPPF